MEENTFNEKVQKALEQHRKKQAQLFKELIEKYRIADPSTAEK